MFLIDIMCVRDIGFVRYLLIFYFIGAEPQRLWFCEQSTSLLFVCLPSKHCVSFQSVYDFFITSFVQFASGFSQSPLFKVLIPVSCTWQHLAMRYIT